MNLNIRQVMHILFVVSYILLMILSNAFNAFNAGLVNSICFFLVVEIIYWSFDELIKKP